MEKPRLVIGHNVGYDRARARESYERRKSAIRFMDTMSMAIPMFGMADHQVVTYESDDSDFTLRVCLFSVFPISQIVFNKLLL
ncbi:unnamed protein product [Angiostrongylus costaricensis]|uniref:DNA-directed DNA polymerase n=1 Tax=Angiostrongylus costaricensis TaxID=334426 RepID=A0A0R3PET4_ANGCS|nr:unnamed protein product [Angiostrongylus costaricensis]